MICESRWTIDVRGGPCAETSLFIKARSGISFTYSNSGNHFFARKLPKRKQQKPKNKERKRRRKLSTILYTINLLV